MKASLLSIAVVLAIGGCAGYPHGPVIDGGPIRNDGFAAIDQPTKVGTVIVTPKVVVEDSRCPMNARCVWAGRVVLKARIDGAGWRETTSLKLGEPYQTHGKIVVLTSVRPEKMTGVQVPPTGYLFGFDPR
jgi:hypothetical protein